MRNYSKVIKGFEKKWFFYGNKEWQYDIKRKNNTKQKIKSNSFFFFLIISNIPERFLMFTTRRCWIHSLKFPEFQRGSARCFKVFVTKQRDESRNGGKFLSFSLFFYMYVSVVYKSYIFAYSLHLKHSSPSRPSRDPHHYFWFFFHVIDFRFIEKVFGQYHPKQLKNWKWHYWTLSN